MVRKSLVILLLIAACTFSTVVFEGGEVTVLDPDGQPLEGATIVILAESQPHAQATDPIQRLSTDSNGKALVEARKDSQMGCLCLPHGVPVHSATVCVGHPDYGEIREAFFDAPWTLQFEEARPLGPGETPCE